MQRQRRIALLTNVITPYRLPVYEALSARVRELRVFVSVKLERSGQWSGIWRSEHGSLDVTEQRHLRIKSAWRHPHGFTEPLDVLLPYDTLPLLMKYRPDSVISGELGLRTLQAALYCRLRPRTRFVVWVTVSEHTERARGAARGLLRRSILPAADAVIVNGDSGARYLRRLGVPDRKLVRIPYAQGISDLMTVAPRRSSGVAHRILFTGQLIERKGLLPFLAVLTRWAAAHTQRVVEFWLAGDGPLRQTLERYPRPANLVLKNLGPVAPSALHDIYAAGGIFVFPTLADEWGVVVNEAMTAGLPVLGSIYSQAVEELVRDGIDGWIFDPHRPDDVYRALDHALSTDDPQLEGMRHAARERVRHITPEYVAERLVQVLDGLN